jgi:hypothetical protein
MLSKMKRYSSGKQKSKEAKGTSESVDTPRPRRLWSWPNKQKGSIPQASSSSGAPAKTMIIFKEMSPLQRAINQLNEAVQRLANINDQPDDDADVKANRDDRDEFVNTPSVQGILDIDTEIDEVTALKPQLLSDQWVLDSRHQGILPTTKTFLRTVSNAFTPATKVILETVAQRSSLVQSHHKTRLIA